MLDFRPNPGEPSLKIVQMWRAWGRRGVPDDPKVCDEATSLDLDFFYNCITPSFLCIIIRQLINKSQFRPFFAEKFCGERVNEKSQKIKRTFYYKLANSQRNPAEMT